MQVKPEVLEYTRQHDCGFPVRIKFEIVPTMKTMAEVQITSMLTYHRLNEYEGITHCPRCGKAFPGHEAKVENFLENPVTDSGKLGNE